MEIAHQLIEERTNQLCIQYSVFDIHGLIKINFEFEHSNHSFCRSCQRGISKQAISTALQFGESFFKQGLIYYVLGENMPAAIQKASEKFRNIVVVVAGDSNQIITCYRSNNPFKNIKMKSKRLCKMNKAA